jgi:hypothetical protein
VTDRPVQPAREGAFLRFDRQLGASDVWVLHLTPAQSGRVHAVAGLPHP